MQQLKNKSKDEKEDTLTLGDQPVKIKCSYCAANQKTEVRFKNGVISYALCFLVFITLPFLIAIICIPIIILMTKNLVHVCSCCDNQVGTDGKIIYALKYADDIVTIKLGEMGFIMTRKLIIIIALISINVLVLAYKINNSISHGHNHKYGHSHAHDHITPVNATWVEFYNECNTKYLFTMREPAMKHCYFKYIDKTVLNWEGYIIRVEDLRGTLKQYIHHAVTILVYMEPTEQTEDSKFPDLQLTFDSEVVDQYTTFLDEINRGNRIGFNATIKSIGFEGQTRHLHVNQIWKLEGQKEIEPHVHHGGRYKDLNKSFRKSKDLIPQEIASSETFQKIQEDAEREEQKAKVEQTEDTEQNTQEQQQQEQQENKEQEINN